MSKRRDPTADAAIKHMSENNVRMRKALKVAQMAIELCMDDLRRRYY